MCFSHAVIKHTADNFLLNTVWLNWLNTQIDRNVRDKKVGVFVRFVRRFTCFSQHCSPDPCAAALVRYHTAANSDTRKWTTRKQRVDNISSA
jgi:hypothetical protein